MTTDTVGGVWTYALQLAKALRAFDVSVVLAAKGRLTADQRWAANAIPNLHLVAKEFKLEWMDDSWKDVDRAGQWLLELADRVQPNVIHLNDYSHGALPWKAPVLVVGHSCILSWIAAVRGIDATDDFRVYHRRLSQGLHAADLVVAPSRHMLASLDYFYGPFANKRVIPNGVDPSQYTAAAKEPYVFSAGRMWDEAKNLATLAAAAPGLQWPVRFAGLPHPDGRTATAKSMQCLGRLSATQMARTYATASIYALPALYEPFGLTVLEAALSDCSLVLGDIPTLRSIWRGAAVFVPPRDPAAWAAAINNLIDQPQARQDYARRARQRAGYLSAERMAGMYHRMYRQMLTQHQASPSSSVGHTS